MTRDNRFLTRYAGAVPDPVAVYRPGNGPLAAALMGMGVMLGLGPAHFALGAIAQLEQESADLIREEAALLNVTEVGGSLSQEQWDRLGAIQERIPKVQNQLSSLKAARDRRREQPTTESVATEITDLSAGKAPTPFRSLGEQLAAVAQAARNPHSPDPRLLAINAAAQGSNELIGSEGGFQVQSDFSAELLRQVYDTGVLSSRVDRRPVGPNANGTKFNIIDETSRADGSRWGGVRAYWTAEAGSLTATKPKYGPTELQLQKLTGLYYATDEELLDVVNLEANANAAFTEEFGFKIDDAIIRGTGAGMPLGILNAAATVSVSKETGQAAATIISENVEKMYARIFARSLSNAIWLINQDCWPQIFQLAHVIGTGGVPMYIPSGGLQDAPFGALLGRPVQPIEQAATVGTVGDIMLADLSQYLMIEKGGIAQASSIHVQFLTDETAFRWVLRTNGRPKRESAVTPFKGSNTQSAFITLATRS